ncbi:bifunctional indole-3-glycerol-phosphate synthase TrpC/phosphoribosylanthranilate isomerase TrpF [Klebsiella aerogenes]|uniref:bifunctional indole-3-glycerol-phosphate synthase TrpC/phosphoribosylanthranilate isomerase TrpF n=1 Tax=Klebsiella aerogenes TaxID=548 RepID=UPI0005F081C6|nr:bifunctional indole-3-glycerol-phosphate synthase TrpC/phosphoribosylanthranilate isomerase TrpF [Klebsiella aerogenes]EIV5803409.1 bifunctional indole-3-glycerol-phosphate synthase TrpC/phosphoribosylanthranilate isomerase TrpF [Klebsiella aerogenes]KJP12685.1 indole-3-glycerol phosphate synthase [Klebsiella aerogenes]MBK0715270.1 bifunctional indole-3-glycerol-phosphate synthase TrpC/phosphoribosylanthranilate isomerase TrpF [Klebsiella aerogenes]MCB8475836.1 bifunctional indole-3-glycerol
MQTVLAKIVADKAIWVEARKQQQPLASFQNDIVPSERHFYDALAGARTAFILECKKASPSKGLIREDFDPATIAGVYKHYASAISVLCDEKYFQGSFDFLPIVSKVAPQPILCKDFTIDPYQIYLARYYQADACLLMLSVLDDDQYRQLAAVAHSLNMGVLTEVSNEEELERAIALKAKVVGINNRDLRDMSIDLNRTRQLAPRLGPDVTVISESGIHTYGEVRELSHFANGFLIGSALMEQPDLSAAVKRVLLGENKVCGLTRPQDAQAAWEAGAIYGGLIFVDGSPRAVNDQQAQAVMAAAPLSYVGVFRDAAIEEVVTRATTLKLAAVQLHGSEDQAWIDALRAALPEQIQIWKALSVGETLPPRNLNHVARYVFDNGQGGSGQRFDWSLLQGQDLRNVMLAGGLSADNCVEAAKSGCAGLDFNSGVESQPGIKEASLVAAVFQTLRAY